MSKFSTFLTRYLYLSGGAGIGTSIAGSAYLANMYFKEATTIQQKLIDTTIGAITGASTGFVVGTMGTITAPIIVPTLCIHLILDKLKPRNS